MQNRDDALPLAKAIYAMQPAMRSRPGHLLEARTWDDAAEVRSQYLEVALFVLGDRPPLAAEDAPTFAARTADAWRTLLVTGKVP